MERCPSLSEFKPIDLAWFDEQEPTAQITLRFSDYVMFSGHELGLKNFSKMVESETDLTLDGKRRKYSCYAINIGGTGHRIAYIKDKKSSQWFYYNDMNSEVYGKPVDIKTIDKELDNKNISFILFYKDITLEEKLIQLKTKLETLKTNLAVLTKKLNELKKNLKK